MLKKAVTLVEVLISLAVVAVLIATLLPVLASARRRANKVPCSSNLRQLSAACLTYADDSDDIYPPSLGALTTVASSSRSLLFCPHDAESEKGGLWCSMMEEAGTDPCPDRTSYGYTYGPLGPLEGKDSSPLDDEKYPGLIACMLHGDEGVPGEPLQIRSGTILRVLRDGSVHSKTMPKSQNGVNLTALFTP
jgi:prepilin-type N-terminal cleavage/methylation domain-containing protein